MGMYPRLRLRLLQAVGKGGIMHDLLGEKECQRWRSRKREAD